MLVHLTHPSKPNALGYLDAFNPPHPRLALESSVLVPRQGKETPKTPATGARAPRLPSPSQPRQCIIVHVRLNSFP